MIEEDIDIDNLLAKKTTTTTPSIQDTYLFKSTTSYPCQ